MRSNGLTSVHRVFYHMTEIKTRIKNQIIKNI